MAFETDRQQRSEADGLDAARRAVDRRRRRERRQKRRARRLRRRALWIGVGVIALNGAALAGLGTPTDPLALETYLGRDKIEHLSAFLAVTALAVPALGRWFSPGLTLLPMLALGLVIEIAQAYAPGHTADFADFVADEVGIVAGWAIGTLVLDRVRARLGAHPRDAVTRTPRPS